MTKSEKNAAIIINKINGFPPLPAVASKLLKVTANPDSSMEYIAEIINMDPSFAMETLRLANSPIWGLMTAIGSIKEALSILGISAVRDLILSQAVFKSFKRIGQADGMFLKRFWGHSFLCGLAADLLADDLKTDKNHCFIAGLLHDIGKLVIYLAFPNEFAQIMAQSKERLFGSTAAESVVLGVTHSQVGRGLLKKWLFPENLVTALGSHHHPLNPWKADDPLPMIINIADLMSNCVQIQDETQIDTADCNDLLITRQNINFFERYHKPWNEHELLLYMERLTQLQEKNKETLRLFLS